MPLGHLPAELRLAIASHLISDADINAFAKSNKANYEVLDEFLYRRNAKHHLGTDKSALIWAASSHRVATARKALRYGADLNAAAKRRDKPIQRALKNCDEEMVRLLAENGAVVGDPKNMYLAIVHGLGSSVVRFLLEQGCSPNGRGIYRQTPLMWVVERGDEEILAALVEAGAEINAKDGDDYSPLCHVAIHEHVDCARRLLDLGADIHHKCRGGYTPLAVAVAHNQEDMVEFLLDRGADIDVQDDGGDTPLAIAANRGHINMVKLLLRRGALVEVRVWQQQTALHRAASSLADEAAGIIQVFLDHGIDLEIKDGNGRTMVSWAAMTKNRHALDFLIKKKGADINVLDNDGESPLALAARAVSGRNDVVDMLLENGAILKWNPDKGSPLSKAISYNMTDMIDTLLKAGADINSRGIEGRTPLIDAVSGHWDKSIEFLLARGADANLQDDHGRTAMLLAISYRNPKGFSLLLEHGADVHIAASNGLSVFALVIQHGWVSYVKELLQMGVDVNGRDNEGRTWLSVGAVHRRKDIIRILLKNGADPEYVDDFGRTAADMARDAGNAGVIEEVLMEMTMEDSNEGIRRPGM